MLWQSKLQLLCFLFHYAFTRFYKMQYKCWGYYRSIDICPPTLPFPKTLGDMRIFMSGVTNLWVFEVLQEYPLV